MELALFVYIAGIIGNVGGVLVLLSVLAFLSFGVYLMYHYLDINKRPKYNWVFVPIIIAFLAAITPSEKTMYMMAAAYAGQTIVQSETADRVVTILNKKLDSYLEEISNEGTGKGK